MPFSITAAVGFIALSEVAVLNGLVMLSFINQLRQRRTDRGCHLPRGVMLTGDNAGAAQTIAQDTGVDEVRAELLPGDKVAAVEMAVDDHRLRSAQRMRLLAPLYE
jgi:cation transport ATPase